MLPRLRKYLREQWGRSTLAWATQYISFYKARQSLTKISLLLISTYGYILS